MEAVEAVGANARWRMPNKGMLKISVHGSFFAAAFPNGNVSGIGVVVRNSRGRILKMLSGSLGIQNQRVNEYFAMLEGCKQAYFEDWSHFYLESDHLDSFWEWKNSSLEGVHPDHAYVVQQLNQRQIDRNFHMEVTLCDPEANALATYLADYGAEHFKVMVVIAEPFGRVHELWNQDMGLGPAKERFMAIHEADLAPVVDNEDEVQAPAVEDEAGDARMIMNAEGEMVEVIQVED